MEYVYYLRYAPGSFHLQIRFSKQHEWNKAVAEAERLVGFPTSLNSLQLVMNDDSISMTAYIKKLMASDHPVLKTVKRMVYNDKNEMQVTCVQNATP